MTDYLKAMDGYILHLQLMMASFDLTSCSHQCSFGSTSGLCLIGASHINAIMLNYSWKYIYILQDEAQLEISIRVLLVFIA